MLQSDLGRQFGSEQADDWSLMMEFNASAELKPHRCVMDEVHMPRSSLRKCRDVNETKKILVLDLGVISTHLNLSLPIRDSYWDKMRQASQSFGNCSPKPVFPYNQASLQNDCFVQDTTKAPSAGG